MEERESKLFENDFLIASLFLDPRCNSLFNKSENSALKERTINFLCKIHDKIEAGKGLIKLKVGEFSYVLYMRILIS